LRIASFANKGWGEGRSSREGRIFERDFKGGERPLEHLKEKDIRGSSENAEARNGNSISQWESWG